MLGWTLCAIFRRCLGSFNLKRVAAERVGWVVSVSTDGGFAHRKWCWAGEWRVEGSEGAGHVQCCIRRCTVRHYTTTIPLGPLSNAV